MGEIQHRGGERILNTLLKSKLKHELSLRQGICKIL